MEGLRSTSTAIDAKGVIEQIIFTQRFKQKHTYFFEKAGTIPQSLASELVALLDAETHVQLLHCQAVKSRLQSPLSVWLGSLAYCEPQ